MASEITDLPDFPALQQLARAMWRIGSTRGAAVMIGAGFTRNVDLPSDDSKKPPLWNSLRDDLINELYHKNPFSAPSNSLRIAEEYRTTYGQAALDSFIRARFPDRAWQPGPLHLELLNLEWSEVLTTNWDTVLERTAEKVARHNYEVVRNEADLTYARSPRIVKLHGTLGDKEPLVFAEEDYRHYPAQHAAFVNFARQVFIENELCLLGFSGDDPNFLQWAGWVRDQLGGKARRIYLVGYLNLSPATRRYFEAHNIAPVDFAPIITQGSTDQRHAEAARLFFKAMRDAKPAPRHVWTLTRHDASPVGRDSIDGSDRIRKDVAYAASVLSELTELLRKDRLSYPGWLVCPRKYRRQLRYVGAEQWVWRKDVLATFKPARRAEILYELVWRRTTGMDPLEEALEHHIAELLSGDTTGVAHHLLAELGLAMMRNARMSDDQDAMTVWGLYVEKYTPADDPLRLWVHYQHGLRARDVLDFRLLAERANSIISDAPDWRMRRAALVAQAGHYSKAIELYRATEKDLGARARNDRSSLWIKSRQGWVEWLAGAIDLARFQHRDDPERERFFRASEIDPGEEIDDIRRAAEHEAQKMRREVSSIEPLFRAGHYRDTGNQAAGDGILHWYEADQLLEAAGIPVSIGHVNLCGHMVLRSADASYRAEYFWYTWLLRGLHSHFDDAFKDYFGRLMIARLPESEARRLIDTVNTALEYWREQWVNARHPIDRDDVGKALDSLRLYIMALAHLTPRMSVAEAKAAYRKGVELARDQEIRHHWIIEAIGSLLSYAVESVPKTERGELALDAAQFPLAFEKGVDNEFLWPKAAVTLWGVKINRDNNPAWRTRVGELIQAARSSRSREAAILMLTVLDEGGALLAEEKVTFGEALWSQVDDDRNPLPKDAGLLDSSYLDLPAPAGIDVRARVRARVVDADIIAVITHPKPIDSQDVQARQNQLSALRLQAVTTILEPERAVQIFDQLVTWEPATGTRKDSFAVSTIRGYNDVLLRRIGEVVGTVAVPAMRPDDRTLERSKALIDFIQRHGVWDAIPGLPYFAVADSRLENDVVGVLRRAVWGGDHQQVSNAAYAVLLWAKEAATRSHDGVLPRALIDAVLSAIDARPEQGLEMLLRAAKGLLIRGFLKTDDMERLADALEPLLGDLRYASVAPRSMRSVSVSLERAQCVELAKELTVRIGTREVLQTWLSEGVHDPMPEVRFAAQDYDGETEHL